MIELTNEIIKELDTLIENEVSLIEFGFNKSELLGKVYIGNSISSFVENYLNRKYGNVAPQLSAEYRYFIIGILNNISQEFKEIALKEVLIPTVRNVGNTELLQVLEGVQNV